MADPIIGAGYNSDIAYRYKPGQTAAEFYSQKTQQTFGNADALASYINSTYAGSNATADNVFGVLAGGYTPRATALEQITTSLNEQQNKTFSEQNAPKRASSSLTDSINTDQTALDSALAEFNTLKSKMASLETPNYQQTYNDLRTEQGVPQLEGDIAANNKAIRELPYVNRMNSGNAGVMTEGQLGADTTQKGIPLEIQQGNLLDRLKLAQDFITNSMKFKEADYSTAQAGIQSAMDIVANTIQYTRQHLQDLQTKQNEQQQREQTAQQFAFENRITAPFYDIGGTVFRTSDRMPAHNKEEYIAMGGKGDFSDVQKVTPKPSYTEVNPGNTLIDNYTGQPVYQAPARATSSSSGGLRSGAIGGNTKPVTSGDSSKYGIPTYVTQGEVTAVRNGIRAVIQSVGSVNDQNRWDLWGQVSDALKELGLKPEDFDGLLWEAFHPKGLVGFNEFSPNSTKAKPKSGGNSIIDQINELPD